MWRFDNTQRRRRLNQLNDSLHPDAAPPIVLTIAGSDSGGGAGVQADLKTFAALGCHGVSAVTALTAQNTRQVSAIWMVPADLLRAQIDALFDDFDIRSVKTGMLGNVAVIREVVAALKRHAPPSIVVDPVMVATSGDRLLESDALDCLRHELIPMASLLTPNLPEAELLLGHSIRPGEMAEAARALRATGAAAILLKGGHAVDGADISDHLVDADGEWRFQRPRLRLIAHGTGCTLSAACAAHLARGRAMRAAVEYAGDFVHEALRRAFRPGRGEVAVLNHFAAGRDVV